MPLMTKTVHCMFIYTITYTKKHKKNIKLKIKHLD